MPDIRRIHSLSLVPLVVMVCALLSACGEDAEEQTGGLSNRIFASHTDDPKIPVIAVHENGDMLAVISGDGQTVTGAAYMTKDGDSLVVWAGADGLPRRAQGDGVIVLFGNYTDSTVDVAIMGPAGSTEILRGVAVDIPANNPQAPRLMALSPAAADVTLAGSLRGASIMISIVGCAASAAATVGTHGLTLPIFLKACGAAVVSVTAALVAATNDGDMV